MSNIIVVASFYEAWNASYLLARQSFWRESSNYWLCCYSSFL